MRVIAPLLIAIVATSRSCEWSSELAVFEDDAMMRFLGHGNLRAGDRRSNQDKECGTTGQGR
jgi:hypothetical protein